MRRMLRVLNTAAQLKQLLLQKQQNQKRKRHLKLLNIFSHVVYSSAQKEAFALQLLPVCSGGSFIKGFPGAALGCPCQATAKGNC